jgi:signal transduction histidine kinase
VNLYQKHILAAAAVFLMVIGIVTLINYEIHQRQSEDMKRQRGELFAEVITSGLKTIMLEGKSKEEFQRFIEGLAVEGIEAVRIFSENGTILSSTVPGEIGQRMDDAHAKTDKAGERPSVVAREGQGRSVYSTVVVMNNEWPCQRCHGTDGQIRAIIDLEVSHREIDTSAKKAAAWSLFAFAGTVSILSIGLYVLGRHQITKPLKQLEREVRTIADGDLKTGASVQGSDEISAIASSVNRLAAELRKKREDVMRFESREMSHMEKMASIGELAATVAHEIKNPLAGISGALQVMVEDIPEKSPRREVCNDILAEIERLDRAVKDLIIYAKPQEINPEPTDLNAVVQHAVAAVSSSADQMHVTIDLLTGMLPETMADPEQMKKVISDVLLYQCTLMPDGGNIMVSTSSSREHDEIEVLCSDTAQAMGTEEIRSIFKPSFSTKHSGTGLSLAISRNIVQNHGGRIRVESEVGIGNSFHIIIPVKR